MAVVERPFFANPLAAAGGRAIVSPFQFTTDDDDNLRIVSANSLAGVVLTMQGRRVDENGTIVPFVYTHTPNTDRSLKAENFKFGRGALLNLTVFASSGAPVNGQTYVIVQLIKGFSGATIVLGTLLAGYVTSNAALAFPGSPITSSLDGSGYVRQFVGTDPAPGIAVDEVVPSGARWELLALRYTTVTNAAAGQRVPYLNIYVGATTVLVVPGSTGQLASLTYTWNWLQNFDNSAITIVAGNVASYFPPNLPLLAGTHIQATAEGFAAGDDWSAPIVTVREWLEVS